jgi:ABC-2 type transport system ATP-binding protein
MGDAHVLRTFGLTKRYGRSAAVDGLDLQLESGQVYGFLGRNGAGKTTTIRMLMGIIGADSGEIEYFGERRRRPNPALKRRIGYVSQSQHFYPWMTVERLGRFVGGFYPTWDAAEYQRLLELLCVPVDRRVAALSQGMRVKVALALALAHHPTLLILDEPTAGLDPAARREFLELIGGRARAEHRSIFFSSHLVDEVERVADRIGIIDYGKLRYQGGRERLMQSVARVAIAEAPPEFRVLSRQDSERGPMLVLEAAPEIWQAAAFPPELVEPMPLEDIFLAMAVGRVALAQ